MIDSSECGELREGREFKVGREFRDIKEGRALREFKENSDISDI